MLAGGPRHVPRAGGRGGRRTCETCEAMRQRRCETRETRDTRDTNDVRPAAPGNPTPTRTRDARRSLTKSSRRKKGSRQVKAKTRYLEKWSRAHSASNLARHSRVPDPILFVPRPLRRVGEGRWARCRWSAPPHARRAARGNPRTASCALAIDLDATSTQQTRALLCVPPHEVARQTRDDARRREQPKSVTARPKIVTAQLDVLFLIRLQKDLDTFISELLT